MHMKLISNLMYSRNPVPCSFFRCGGAISVLGDVMPASNSLHVNVAPTVTAYNPFRQWSARWAISRFSAVPRSAIKPQWASSASGLPKPRLAARCYRSKASASQTHRPFRCCPASHIAQYGRGARYRLLL